MKIEKYIWTLDELVTSNKVKLGRGNIISKKDIANLPGEFPIYSSAREKNGTFGYYGKYMFDEELITWSIDGGGRLFYRPRHKFSVTNVGGTLRILDAEFLDCRYLHLVLTHLHSKIRFDWVYKAHPSVIRTVYKDIPIPPLDKQREIVEKLDNTFTEIDLLEDNFAKLISLNESLLSAKINAELGAIWGSAETKTLGDFGKISYGYTAKSSNSHEGPKYLRITDIQNKSVNWSEVPSCEISSEEKSKFLLSKGDIVFARTGATTGKSYLINVDVDAVFASYLIRIKPDPKKLNPEFLYYFFQSAYYWDEIAEGISGSAQGGFNASKLQAMNVSFPTDLKIQGEIVKRIREFEIELNLRIRNLLDEVKMAKSLRQSILINAFTQKEEVA